MDQSHSFSIQRIYKPVILLGLVLLVTLYLYNKYRSYAILSQPDTYLETQLIPVNTPSSAKKDEEVLVSWRVESPVPRVAQKVGLLLSSVSTPSAIPFTVAPSELIYTNYNKTFSLGNFSLPYEFKAGIRAGEKDVYYRFYALVDGRYIYSPEFKLSVD